MRSLEACDQQWTTSDLKPGLTHMCWRDQGHVGEHQCHECPATLLIGRIGSAAEAPKEKATP